ncbi:MAG TPA: ABC transporter permease [Chloroflexi bacterium]|jgi:ABC-type transport system involved in multi-copper enzyme maturation permease subunit|nr:ABC transporter permease [Chloroflexota bacterium]HCG29954.1 ABC transporter permease [Chloroflexota bacterium]
MRVLLIARLTFSEAFRRKMILAVLLLSVLFLALYVFGFQIFREDMLQYRQERLGRAQDLLPYDVQASAMVLLGLYTVNFLAGIMTIFAAVGAISGEIEAGTFQSILPKPISRWEIITGKYLGFLVMIAVYVGLMVGGVVLVSRVVGHYMPPNIFHGLALMILVAAILLALTMFGSTIFSTMANGIVVLMLYGMALTGGLVEQVGAALDNDTMVRIGVITSVVLPSDSMWRLASDVVQPPSAVDLLGPTPFGTISPPSEFAVRYAVAYCVILVAVSAITFNRRDI